MMGTTKTSFSLPVGQWAADVCAIGLSVSPSASTDSLHREWTSIARGRHQALPVRTSKKSFRNFAEIRVCPDCFGRRQRGCETLSYPLTDPCQFEIPPDTRFL